MNSLSKFYFEHLNICGLILTDGGVTAADTWSQPSLSPLRCKHSSDLFDNICVGEAEEEGQEGEEEEEEEALWKLLEP